MRHFDDYVRYLENDLADLKDKNPSITILTFATTRFICLEFFTQKSCEATVATQIGSDVIFVTGDDETYEVRELESIKEVH